MSPSSVLLASPVGAIIFLYCRDLVSVFRSPFVALSRSSHVQFPSFDTWSIHTVIFLLILFVFKIIFIDVFLFVFNFFPLILLLLAAVISLSFALSEQIFLVLSLRFFVYSSSYLLFLASLGMNSNTITLSGSFFFLFLFSFSSFLYLIYILWSLFITSFPIFNRFPPPNTLSFFFYLAKRNDLFIQQHSLSLLTGEWGQLYFNQ